MNIKKNLTLKITKSNLVVRTEPKGTHGEGAFNDITDETVPYSATDTDIGWYEGVKNGGKRWNTH